MCANNYYAPVKFFKMTILKDKIITNAGQAAYDNDHYQTD